jgi:hypothetical protein
MSLWEMFSNLFFTYTAGPTLFSAMLAIFTIFAGMTISATRTGSRGIFIFENSKGKNESRNRKNN